MSVPLRPLRRITVVGGTHGNELTGVALVREVESRRTDWPGLEIRTLIGNPEAVIRCRRFIDRDLNRAFRPSELADATLTDHESSRAREVAEALRPGGIPAMDLIIDLHTTTSNMGISLLLATDDPVALELTAHVAAAVPSRILLLGALWPDDPPYLKTLAPHSLAIEVGPIPQGVLRHDILDRTRSALFAALTHLDRYSLGGSPSDAGATLSAFEAIENVPYPLDATGHPMLVHRDLQDRDWQPLQAGQPLFVAVDGAVHPCPREWSGLCPVFINEAAYFPSAAFVLTRRVERSLPPGGKSEKQDRESSTETGRPLS